MKIWTGKNKALLAFIVIAFIQSIIVRSGVPFRYDWSWPIFGLKQFWDGLIGVNSFGLFSAASRNGPAIFGLFGLIHFPPSIFLKIFLFFVHFVAGYGFYRFVRTRVKSETVAIVSGLAYAFTPYIFIRTIVGFVWSMVAYAVLPIFLFKFCQTKKTVIDYLIIGFLFSLIFCQTQAGLLTLLVITVYSIIALFDQSRVIAIKKYFLTLVSLFIVTLPWLIVMLFKKQDTSIISGSTVTTLNFIASLPHSFRNFFMLSDHHITTNFFYSLAHDKLFIAGWLIVWFVAFCAIFNKKNRELTWTLIISCLIVLPFIKGPLGVFGKFYIWFFNNFPQIAVFRETYHFEFLFAIALCVLFAFGLDWLWQKISDFKLSVTGYQLPVWLKTGLKTLFAGSALFIIAPYLTFDYAGYLKMQKIPDSYYELNSFFKENKDYCKKIYYPPGTGFLYFNNNNQPGIASNSDTIASSLGVPYLSDGTSVLNLPSEEMFFRNELVSQFYEKGEDNGEFAGLLSEGGIDCVILRLDTESKYYQASNLWQEKDPAIVKKWNNIYLKELVESKKGLVLDKQFGENIWIYKVDPTTEIRIDRNYEITNKTGNPTIQQFNPSITADDGIPSESGTIVSLRLTDWANNYAYYRDGWSRGRYDFWRKHLFTQLRQDFIYTDKTDSLLSGKIDERGDYELWGRYLTGGTQGSYQLTVISYQYTVTKDQGEERFIWKKMGDVTLNGKTNVEIKNISGENAIADIVLVQH